MTVFSPLFAPPLATGPTRGLQRRSRAQYRAQALVRAQAERKATDAYLLDVLAEAAPRLWGSGSSTATDRAN